MGTAPRSRKSIEEENGRATRTGFPPISGRVAAATTGVLSVSDIYISFLEPWFAPCSLLAFSLLAFEEGGNSFTFEHQRAMQRAVGCCWCLVLVAERNGGGL